MTRWTLAALLGVAALFLAEPSGAEPLSVTTSDGWAGVVTDASPADNRPTVYLEAAREYWGAQPSCGAVRIVRLDVLAYGDGERVGGYASGDCRIAVTDAALSMLNDPAVCALTVHEYGHLLGHSHAVTPSDPAGVMSSTLAGRPRSCPTVSHRTTQRLGSRRRDRAWCRRHLQTCWIYYPRVYARALPAR